MKDEPVRASEVITRIADAARAVGFQAGVGAMETAGSIVSFLAANPHRIPDFMAGGSILDWPFNWHCAGCLTWQGAGQDPLAGRAGAKAMTSDLAARIEAAEGTPTLVSDAEIDALVAKGWDWHSAYRHLQGAAHANEALRAKENDRER